MTSGQINQCHLIQVENDTNHWTRISSSLPSLISVQLKVTLTLLFHLNLFRGFFFSSYPIADAFSTPFYHYLIFFLVWYSFTYCSVFRSQLFPSLYLSLPSHVKVLVYWTVLKLSVSRSITLCWICSARLSSYWLTTLNEPTHVRKEPKLYPLLIWWWATGNTTLPDLSATLISFFFFFHCVCVSLSFPPAFAGHLRPQLWGSAGLLKLNNPWNVSSLQGLHTQTGYDAVEQHLHTKLHLNSCWLYFPQQ